MQKPLMSAPATDQLITVPERLAAQAYRTAASAARHLLPDGRRAGRTSVTAHLAPMEQWGVAARMLPLFLTGNPLRRRPGRPHTVPAGQR